jgi:hypothetical protein
MRLLLAKWKQDWPDGYRSPEHAAALLVEHASAPPSWLEQDAPIEFCPNNGKRFFVQYPLTVLELDVEGKPIAPPLPMWKVPLFREVKP